MNQLSFRFTSFLLAALFVLAGTVPGLVGQETDAVDVSFEEALPSGTIFYAEVNDLQKNWAEMKGDFYDTLSEEQKQTFDTRKKELMKTISSRVESESGVDLKNVLPHVTRLQVAFPSVKADISSVTSMRGANLENASFAMAVSVDRADLFSQMLTGKLAEHLEKERRVNDYQIYKITPPEDTETDRPAYLLHRGKTLFAALNADRLEGLAGGDSLPETSLAENEKFNASRIEEGGDGMGFGYVNFTSVWSTLQSSLNRKYTGIYQKLSSALGFEELKSMFLTLNHDENTLTFSGGANMTGKSFPLYELLVKMEPGDLELVEDVPSSAFLGTVSKFPNLKERWPKIKAKVIEIMTLFGQPKKQARGAIMMGTAQIQKQLNVGLKELLGQFGDEMSFYLTPPGGTKAEKTPKASAYAKEIVFSLKLRDLERTETLFRKKIRNAPGFQNLKKMEKTKDHEGTTLYTYPAPAPMTPTVFFHNDQFYFTGSPEGARELIDGEGAHAKSITDTGWHEAMREHLPDELSAIQFTENSEYATFLSAVREAQGDASNFSFAGSSLQELTDASTEPAGGLSGSLTTSEQFRWTSVSRLDFSTLNAEKLNELLKKWNKELKKKMK